MDWWKPTDETFHVHPWDLVQLALARRHGCHWCDIAIAWWRELNRAGRFVEPLIFWGSRKVMNKNGQVGPIAVSGSLKKGGW